MRHTRTLPPAVRSAASADAAAAAAAGRTDPVPVATAAATVGCWDYLLGWWRLLLALLRLLQLLLMARLPLLLRGIALLWRRRRLLGRLLGQGRVTAQDEPAHQLLTAAVATGGQDRRGRIGGGWQARVQQRLDDTHSAYTKRNFGWDFQLGNQAIP